MTVIKPDDLMTETEVYEKYKGLFADRELREARRSCVNGDRMRPAVRVWRVGAVWPNLDIDSHNLLKRITQTIHS